MSRPTSRPPSAGLAALRAAVAEHRRTELARQARAAAVLGGEGAAGRLGTQPRVRTGAGTAEPADTVVLPAPATPIDGPAVGAIDDSPPAPADLPAPAGDAAVGLRLVERAQAGDADAFGELYDRYFDVVYRYVYYRVASPQLAEDLTSETFLRALRRIGSFTWQGRDVGAWFVTIARNLIADHYKSSRYRLELTTDDVSDSAAPPVQEGPEREVLESMQNAVLLEAVRKLNAEQQECIALRFLQGLSVAETAQIMGKNEGAIKALQYRAVRSLGRLLPEGVEL